VRLYRLAVEQNYCIAQFNLAVAHFNGTGVARDYIEAVRLLRLAAGQRSGDACYNLAMCYECGLGVEMNLEEAICWYRRAVDNNDMAAKTRLNELLSSSNAGQAH
jgi:TPR repeat protein